VDDRVYYFTPRHDRVDIIIRASNFVHRKWRQERDTLAREKGGLVTQYENLKEKIRDVENIRKYAEQVQRAIDPPTKKQAQGLDI
jgi:hypothetical protein